MSEFVRSEVTRKKLSS